MEDFHKKRILSLVTHIPIRNKEIVKYIYSHPVADVVVTVVVAIVVVVVAAAVMFVIKFPPTLSSALITCQDGIAKIASLCNHR